jgi:hypothetical protein
MIRLSIGALALALTFPAEAPTTESALGPPWISIEHPVNPYDSTTKSAFLLVHAFHHGTPTNFPVSGTAEGLVRGERKSVSLEFQPTSRPGVYALKRQWSTEGTWTLVVSVSQGPEDAVYAVVELSGNGLVASVQVPTRNEKGYTLPAKVAMNAVDASLRARAGVVAQQRP